VLKRLDKEGSNPYPRPVSIPKLSKTDKGTVMRLYIGEGDFTTQALREKNINIPILHETRSQYVFSTLALRVAYVSSIRDREPWVEFHQRDPVNNSTWQDAWDVGAAGYVDPQNHRYTESNKTISPKIACASELIEELALKGHQLPFEDHFHFFGYAQDLPSRHIILLCLCESGYTPDPYRKPPADERTGKQFVKGYDHCILNPDAIAEFIVLRKHWVPSAILTLILTLEFFGYPKTDIEQAFAKRRLQEFVDLSP
jgi:hypothetical protein